VDATGRRRAARAVCGISIAALIAALALAASHGGAVWWILIWGMPVLGFAGVGLVLSVRVADNPIGWLFLGVGCSLGCGVAADAYGQPALHGPGWVEVALLASILEPLPLVIVPLMLALFPHGRLPSRRSRAFGLVWAAAAVLVLLDLIVSPGAISTFSDVKLPQNPIGIGHVLGAVIHAAGGLAFLVLVAELLVGAVSLVSRFRRSKGALREQLKWFGAASALLAAGVLAGPLGLWNIWSGNLFLLVEALGLTAVVLATGIAILRYRLYDIDRLVSRTLSYAILTGLLVVVYLGVVTIATRALPLSSPVGVAASTLAAAALFNPLRTRVQRLVDRRFNRARYDADATLAVFAAHLRDEVDLGSVESSLIEAVTGSLEPAHASLWIRAGSGTSSPLA
jgi:hypothetical protein